MLFSLPLTPEHYPHAVTCTLLWRLARSREKLQGDGSPGVGKRWGQRCLFCLWTEARGWGQVRHTESDESPVPPPCFSRHHCP